MTNWKKAKSKWEIAKRVLVCTTLFWIGETVYFLIKEGWHIVATSKSEIFCDAIVNLGWILSLALAGMVVVDVIDYLLNESEQKH